MSDELSTSSPNLPLSANNPTTNAEATEAPEIQSSSPRAEDLQRTRSRIQAKKQLEMIDGLLRNLDIMIYCELSALYYMDCSTFRFLIRAVVQFFYLTPKPPFIPQTPKNRPYLGAILGTSILCALLHLLFAPPEAGEAMRGYLHGGLMIDFVGQKGHVSKFSLLALDLLTLTMQLFMLAAKVEHQSIKEKPESRTDSTPVAAFDDAATSSQNHDSEERGILRSELLDVDDIELNTFTSRSRDGLARTLSEEADNQDIERTYTGLASSPTEESRDHPLDTFHSGEMVVVNLYLFDFIHKRYRAFGNLDMGVTNVSSFESPNRLVRNFLRGTRDRGERFRDDHLERS